jgi:hypothetical protein
MNVRKGKAQAEHDTIADALAEGRVERHSCYGLLKLWDGMKVAASGKYSAHRLQMVQQASLYKYGSRATGPSSLGPETDARREMMVIPSSQVKRLRRELASAEDAIAGRPCGTAAARGLQPRRAAMGISAWSIDWSTDKSGRLRLLSRERFDKAQKSELWHLVTRAGQWTAASVTRHRYSNRSTAQATVEWGRPGALLWGEFREGHVVGGLGAARRPTSDL